MFSENFIFIDAALENINFFAVNNKKNYSLKIKNIQKSENLPILLKKFLSSNKIKINNTFNVYINLGPGNLIAIRNAITTAKTFSIIYNCNIFGVSFFDIVVRFADTFCRSQYPIGKPHIGNKRCCIELFFNQYQTPPIPK